MHRSSPTTGSLCRMGRATPWAEVRAARPLLPPRSPPTRPSPVARPASSPLPARRRLTRLGRAVGLIRRRKKKGVFPRRVARPCDGSNPNTCALTPLPPAPPPSRQGVCQACLRLGTACRAARWGVACRGSRRCVRRALARVPVCAPERPLGRDHARDRCDAGVGARRGWWGKRARRRAGSPSCALSLSREERDVLTPPRGGTALPARRHSSSSSRSRRWAPGNSQWGACRRAQ